MNVLPYKCFPNFLSYILPYKVGSPTFFWIRKFWDYSPTILLLLTHITALKLFHHILTNLCLWIFLKILKFRNKIIVSRYSQNSYLFSLHFIVETTSNRHFEHLGQPSDCIIYKQFLLFSCINEGVALRSCFNVKFW